MERIQVLKSFFKTFHKISFLLMLKNSVLFTCTGSLFFPLELFLRLVKWITNLIYLVYSSVSRRKCTALNKIHHFKIRFAYRSVHPPPPVFLAGVEVFPLFRVGFLDPSRFFFLSFTCVLVAFAWNGAAYPIILYLECLLCFE